MRKSDETSSRPVRKAGPPVPDWLFHYEGQWAKADATAGLTAAAVVIPNALAYASIAGLPVQAGLYTAFVPMVIYAVLGTSRPLSVSTTTTLAILAAAALGHAVPDGNPAALLAATATLAAMVGCMLVLAAVLRLGFLANFISAPVLTGFKAGIAIVIIADQVPKLLGIHFPKGSFLHNARAIGEGIPHASLTTVALSAVCVGALLAMRRFLPRVPAPLVVIACAVAGAGLFGLSAHGVQTVGHVPTGLPSLTLPDLSLAGQLWPMALGIALMSFTETVAAGRAFVQGGEPTPAANRELLATGLGNLGGAFLGAMPAGGGTTQTAVNRQAGARTQVAALVTAAVALGCMLLLAPVIGLIPHAALAAVVIVYSSGLFDTAEFRAIHSVRRTEFVWALAALAGVVLLGTLHGILVAIVVSLAALAYQVSDPPVHVLVRKRGTNVFRPKAEAHPEDESFPGMLLLRPEGRIFFANAEHISHKMRPLIDEAKPAIVVLDFGGVFDIEYTALRMLIQAEQRLRQAGVSLWLVGLNPGVLAMVQRSPLGETLGRERMFFNLEQAVAHEQARAVDEKAG
jgi:high affinity sulfate transporter 1